MSSPVEEIKSRLDLIDVVREYVPGLVQAGDNWKARCPFHQEKSASFMVSRSKQIWHCFGCGEGGDLFGFVMKMEHLEFVEALRLLAGRAGVVLTRQDRGQQTQKTRLLDLLEAVTGYYIDTLWNAPEASVAREYLLGKRQMTKETLTLFRIGYAPNGWDTTLQWILAKGFTEQDLEASGMVVRRSTEGGSQQHRLPFYDRFRGRVMFPLINIHGSVVGFGGRALNDDPQTPKYINSPQTILYDKSSYLYGLDKAKKAIGDEKRAMIVEGYMDVIAAHTAGTNWVVAAAGTALTKEHITLVKRWTNDLVMVFDRDRAGELAAHRGSRLATQLGMRVWAITFDPTQGKDPDEVIRNHPEVWHEWCQHPRLYVELMCHRLMLELVQARQSQKNVIVGQIYDELSAAGDMMITAEVLKRLSEQESIPYAVLWEQFQRRQALLRASSSTMPAQATAATPVSRSFNDMDRIREQLLLLMVYDPKRVASAVSALESPLLAAPDQLLYNELIHWSQSEGEHDEAFSASTAELQRRFDILQLQAQTVWSTVESDLIPNAAMALVRRFRKHTLTQQLRGLESRMRTLEQAGDGGAGLAVLLDECRAISQKLQELE